MARARGWLERAAERATSLAAAEEAQRAFEAAAELADDPAERARLIERAGDMARMGNRMNDAEQLLTRARDLYAEAGDPHGSARTAAGIARALVSYGRTEDAIRLAEEAYEVLGADELDRDGAALAAELARLHFFVGDLDTAMTRIESAIPVAERTKDMALLASTLNTKSMLYSVVRPHEAYALVKAALRIALDHDLVFEALRAYNNSMVQLEQLDRSEDTLPLLEEALALARRRGDRRGSTSSPLQRSTECVVRGRWDEAEAHAQEYEPARRTSRLCRRTPISPRSHGSAVTPREQRVGSTASPPWPTRSTAWRGAPEVADPLRPRPDFEGSRAAQEVTSSRHPEQDARRAGFAAVRSSPHVADARPRSACSRPSGCLRRRRAASR